MAMRPGSDQASPPGAKNPSQVPLDLFFQGGSEKEVRGWMARLYFSAFELFPTVLSSEQVIHILCFTEKLQGGS